MDVICDPIATFEHKHCALVSLLLLKSPTLVMRCRVQKHCSQTQRASSCCPADALFSVRRVTT